MLISLHIYLSGLYIDFNLVEEFVFSDISVNEVEINEIKSFYFCLCFIISFNPKIRIKIQNCSETNIKLFLNETTDSIKFYIIPIKNKFTKIGMPLSYLSIKINFRHLLWIFK